MTPLERAARALGDVTFPDDTLEVRLRSVLDAAELREAVRAVLQEFREPSEGMKRSWLGPEPWDDDALEVWQAMIDAALNEPTISGCKVSNTGAPGFYVDRIEGVHISDNRVVFKVGDRITTEMPVSRRWWQFWKPRSWIEIVERPVSSITME